MLVPALHAAGPLQGTAQLPPANFPSAPLYFGGERKCAIRRQADGRK